MAKVLVTRSSLEDIANAIRAKGVAGNFKPGAMALAISNIPTGSGAAHILDGTATTLSDGSVRKLVRPENVYRHVTSVNMPDVTELEEGFMRGHTALESVTFWGLGIIPKEAFSGCTSLTTVDILNLSEIGDEAFSGCASLTAINIENTFSIGKAAFFNANLANVYAPELHAVNEQTFSCNVNLVQAKCDNAEMVHGEAFYGDTKLKKVFLPMVKFMAGPSIFGDCPALEEIHIGTHHTGVCTLSGGLGINPMGTAYIYVPDSMVGYYKVADGWMDYHEIIRAESDTPTV